MIRVLHSVSNMARAGIETFLMNYYREMDRDQIQFDFLANKPDPGDYDEEIRSMGGKIFVSPGFNPLHFQAYKRYMADLLRNNPDIEMIHSHNGALGYYSLKSAKDAGLQVRIMHAHSTRIPPDYKYPLKLVCKQLLPSVATNFWGCGRDAGIFYFGEKRWKSSGFIVHNAIDLPKFQFHPEVRRRIRQLHNLEANYVIGHVGRFSIAKNHSRLLDIFSAVLKIFPEARLALIGIGELMQAAREKAQALGIQDQVLFLGQKANVNEWYQAMDCFVMPSRFEGLPVVGVEAQAAGLPCFFSDRVPDEVLLLPDACRVSLQASDEEWARRILAVKQAGGSREQGAEIVRQAGYDIHVEGRKLQKIYLEMAARTTAGKKKRIAVFIGRSIASASRRKTDDQRDRALL